MKMNHRHYILTFFAFVSILASGFCYAFLYRQTTLQASEYLNTVKQIDLQKGTASYEETLTQTFEKYEADRLKIKSLVVREGGLVGFIEQIEKIGPESKTDLELSSIGTTDDKIRARVTAKGGWQEVMTALMMIENLPVSLLISNVRIEGEGSLDSGEAKTTVVKNWRLTLDVETITTK